MRLCLCMPLVFSFYVNPPRIKEAYKIALLSVSPARNFSVSYAVGVLSKESRRLFLPRTYC
jgi:hypothetical protein